MKDSTRPTFVMSKNLPFWGEVTATLDWCEVSVSPQQNRTIAFQDVNFPSIYQQNYQFSSYIAELANTLSNIVTVAMALHGCRMARSQSLPTRYFASYLVRFYEFVSVSLTYSTPHSLGIWSCRHWQFRVPRYAVV